MADLDGKVVLVTGAKGGLGSTVTPAFLDAGATVFGTSRGISDSDFAHPNFTGIPADLSSEAEVDELVRSIVERAGRLDALVHLVGGWAGGTAADTDLATFDRMIEMNFRVAFLAIRASLRAMRTQKSGRILAIGSTAAVEATPSSVAYAASKAALVSLIQSIAAETPATGITANVLLPGTLDTPANRKAMPKADRSTWVDPVKVAALLVELASDAALDVGTVRTVVGG